MLHIITIAALILAAVPAAVYLLAIIFTHASGVQDLFDREVRELLRKQGAAAAGRLTESELASLPPVVRRYLESNGFADSEKIEIARVIYNGEISLKAGGKFMKIRCEQYNSAKLLTRIWYGRIPIAPFVNIEGLHRYVNGKASMLIKFGPLTIADVSGPKMDQTDTITFFNDMFLFMPSAIINPYSRWREVDEHSAEVTYTLGNITARALLRFNDRGELVDFVTDDRYMLEGKSFVKRRWSTPVIEYARLNGRNWVVNGSAVWKSEEGDYEYFKINDKNMVRKFNGDVTR